MATSSASASVTIDVRRRQGQPCVSGTRVQVEDVGDTVWRCGAEQAMRDHGLSRGQVLAACWFLTAYAVEDVAHRPDGTGYRRWRGHWSERWGRWAAGSHEALWRSDWDNVPDPPGVDEERKNLP